MLFGLVNGWPSLGRKAFFGGSLLLSALDKVKLKEWTTIHRSKLLPIWVIAALVITFGIPGPANAADSTVCSTGADFTSIRDAIDDSGTTNGDTITLCAETFGLASIVVIVVWA